MAFFFGVFFGIFGIFGHGSSFVFGVILREEAV
jgi:hypothetical protein